MIEGAHKSVALLLLKFTPKSESPPKQMGTLYITPKNAYKLSDFIFDEFSYSLTKIT